MAEGVYRGKLIQKRKWKGLFEEYRRRRRERKGGKGGREGKRWTTVCFPASAGWVSRGMGGGGRWEGWLVDALLDTRLLVLERSLCGFALDGSGTPSPSP